MWWHLREYWKEWVSLLSGIGSVVLVFVLTIPQTPAGVVGEWVAGYVCLVIAASLIIWRMYDRLRLLEGEGVVGQRRRAAQELLRQLSAGEREALRALLLEHYLTGDQIRSRFQGVDFVRINNQTPFLQLRHDLADVGHITDSWSVRSEWQGALTGLLISPQGWSVWAWCWRRLLVLVREVRGEHRRARRADSKRRAPM